MNFLPFEIYQLIFSRLTEKDLLQCQLTCKRWHETSVELLYCNVKLTRVVEYHKYVDTIINSRFLARHLKYINMNNLLSDLWYTKYDLIGFLGAIVKHCPNLLELHANDPVAMVWTRLTYAASQSHLPRIRCLPQPMNSNIESYIYTVLSFRKTLDTLKLCNRHFHYMYKINYKLSYQTLLNSIKEFSNLKHLQVAHYNNQLLSYWDTWIDSCHHLESFSICLFDITQIETTTGPSKSILQHHKIEKFSCRWEIIKCDEQLKYLMHKFPNLQDFEVLLPINFYSEIKRSTGHLSYNTMAEFLNYSASIPKNNIRCSIEKQHLVDIFVGFQEVINRYKNISIEYEYNEDELHQSKWSVHLQNDLFKIEIVIDENDTELPHQTFLKKAGKNIQRLIVKNEEDILGEFSESAPYDSIFGDDWIYQTLQLCPNLQEFTLYESVYSGASTDITLQHTKLKSFSITHANTETSLDFLERLSFSAPNLETLCLKYTYDYCIRNGHTIKINMPYTRFSLLTWTCITSETNLKYAIKLKTVSEDKLFICKNDKLYPVPIDLYDFFSYLLCFDITCRNLNEFRIILEDSASIKNVYYTHKWSF